MKDSKKETKLVPKLRFKEFEGEWRKSKLETLIASISSGKSSTKNSGSFTMYGSTGPIGETTADYSGGKIIIARVGANAGSVYTVDGSYGVSDNTLILENNLNADQKWLYYFLLASNLNKYIFGSGQPLVTGGLLKKIPTHYPSEDEQQKIASFLTAVDKRIEQLIKKKKLLEEYKKGVMQKIFNQEIRFKDENGNDFPDWEEKRLGEIGKIVTGKTPSTTIASNWVGEIPFVTPTDIDDNKYQSNPTRTVNSNAINNVLPKGSVLYTCIASIGKMSIITKASVSNQQINAIIPNKDLITSEFLYYVLLFNTTRIKKYGANTTLPIINKEEFSNIKIMIPSLKEQLRIEQIFIPIDDILAQITTNISIVSDFKKGLLQQMFL